MLRHISPFSSVVSPPHELDDLSQIPRVVLVCARILCLVDQWCYYVSIYSSMMCALMCGCYFCFQGSQRFSQWEWERNRSRQRPAPKPDDSMTSCDTLGEQEPPQPHSFNAFTVHRFPLKSKVIQTLHEPFIICRVPDGNK